jgi:uncharacterized protein
MSAAPSIGIRRAVVVLASGALFGFGLSVSSMVRPEVVLAFLRFQDMGLLLVMAAALTVTFLAYQWVPRWRRQPLMGDVFHRHVAHWNRDTVVGAALFGVGWGLCGVCPGPALAGLGAGNGDMLWALAGIALGALLQGLRARP